MPSIRKTKKRLKRELAEAQKAFAECDYRDISDYFLANALQDEIESIEDDLEKLKKLKIK